MILYSNIVVFNLNSICVMLFPTSILRHQSLFKGYDAFALWLIDKHVISWYRIIVVRRRHSNDEITLFEHSYHYEFKDVKVINCN